MALLQKLELSSTAGVALWDSDLDANYLIYPIGWAFLNRLADPLDLEQLEL